MEAHEHDVGAHVHQLNPQAEEFVFGELAAAAADAVAADADAANHADVAALAAGEAAAPAAAAADVPGAEAVEEELADLETDEEQEEEEWGYAHVLGAALGGCSGLQSLAIHDAAGADGAMLLMALPGGLT
jgi:hypothetical protein